MATEFEAQLVHISTMYEEALKRIAEGDFNHAEHAKNIAKKVLREAKEYVS